MKPRHDTLALTIVFLTLLGTGTSSAQISEAKLKASDGEESEYFGWTAAISGEYALMGASEDDDLGPASGSAYVFKNLGGVWVQQQNLMASDGDSYDTFGNAVTLSDSFAVIGAQLDDDTGLNSGSVYVFTWDGDSLVEATKLTALDGAEEDHFGSSVAISGDYIVIGASLDDDLGPNSGSAYVFVREGTGWIQEAKLLANDGEIDDRFEEVAISGDYLIVGAWGDKDLGDLTGAAYIFRRDALGWVQEQKLTASDAAGGNQFGLDVGMSGDRVIVGAYSNDFNGENAGSAYIFARNGTTWTEEAKLLASDASEFDQFGISVSLSGEFAIVGADVDDDRGENAGSAYIFARDGTTWTEYLKLTASDGEPYDFFGISVAISNDYVLVGAGGDDDNGFDAGSAYIFANYTGTTGVAENRDFPLEFTLSQNYPNPFNPTTHFGFRISKFGFVSLSIYDLLGREVATVVNEELSPGTYTRILDASGLVSGVYFYRMKTGKFAETKKMVVLR